MGTTATSTFIINSWDEQPYDEQEGAKLSRTRVTKTFHGDLEGTSTAELLMAIAAAEGGMAYVGFERITGTLRDQTGSFVLHHNASGSATAGPSATWTIVPGTGTGALAGIQGTGVITRHPDGIHAFILNYTLSS
jgi:hypothetical protein